MTDQPSVGELSRQVREVLLRFQSLAERLDQSYMSKEVFDLWQRLIDGKVKGVREQCSDTLAVAKGKADVDDVQALKTEKANQSELNALNERVKSLEDNQKWVVRLVLGLILVAVVSAVLVTSGGAR